MAAREAGHNPERPSVSNTKKRIIDAATELFMRRGYAASGLKDISAAGSAPIGSLYHFFPGGKEELAAETLRAAGAAYQALVEAVIDAEPELRAGIHACFDAAGETLRVTDYADACPIATVALEVASTNDTLREVTASIFRAWIDAGAERFEHSGIDPERARDMATVLVAALEGGFLLSRAFKDTGPMRKIGDAMARLFEVAVADKATV